MLDCCRTNSFPNFSEIKDLYNFIITKGESQIILSAKYELSTILEEEALSSTRSLAFELLTQAAKGGNPEAQHRLAAAYMTGIYNGLVPVDPGRYLNIFSLSTEFLCKSKVFKYYLYVQSFDFGLYGSTFWYLIMMNSIL